MNSDTCPTLREVIEALEKQYPSPPKPKPKHLPRSLPAWLKAESMSEITNGDIAWSAAGHEIH